MTEQDTVVDVPKEFAITAALNRALFAQAEASYAAITLAEKEAKLKEATGALETLLLQSNMQGVKSTLGEAEFTQKMVYAPADWQTLHSHIQKTGEFDLLHRRISQTAARDRASNGELPPGIKTNRIVTLTLTVKGVKL